MKKRDRDHKSLWDIITVVNDQENLIFHLDSKGRLIEKFPKDKPRKDLYKSLEKDDKVGITFEDTIGPQLDPDYYFDLGFGLMNNADKFDIGYFPDLNSQFDLSSPFDLNI